MTPYLLKFIKTFSYLYFLRKLNEEKENVPTSGLEDDVQRHTCLLYTSPSPRDRG